VRAVGWLLALAWWVHASTTRADSVDDVKPWFVRVIGVPAGSDSASLAAAGACGSGMVLRAQNGNAWLLTARHVLGVDAPETLWLKFSDGTTHEIPFEQGFEAEHLSGLREVAFGDVVLLPLGPISPVPNAPSPRFGWVGDWYLGGTFKVIALPPENRRECSDPKASQGVVVPVREPKVGPSGRYVPVGAIEGKGASGSPVFTATEARIAGVYVGAADGDSEPRIIWLGSAAMVGLEQLAERVGITGDHFAGLSGRSLTLGVSASAAVMRASDQVDHPFQWELDPSLFLRWSMPLSKHRHGFDEWDLGLEFGWRYSARQERYRLESPQRGVLLERRQHAYHALAVLVSIGLAGRYLSRGALSLAFGPIFECPFKSCAAPLNDGKRVGLSVGLRSRVRLAGSSSAVAPTLGLRMDLVPQRVFGYERVFEDPSQQGPSYRPRYVLELGFQLGGSVRRGFL